MQKILMNAYDIAFITHNIYVTCYEAVYLQQKMTMHFNAQCILMKCQSHDFPSNVWSHDQQD